MVNEEGRVDDVAQSRGDQRFPKALRLLRSDDFARVYRRKRSVADDLLVVYGCENQLERSRLGLSVSRRTGNAVIRNRWKRLLREAFRRSQSQLPQGVDLVVSPRRPGEPRLSAIEQSLQQLARRVDQKLRQTHKE